MGWVILVVVYGVIPILCIVLLLGIWLATISAQKRAEKRMNEQFKKFLDNWPKKAP